MSMEREQLHKYFKNEITVEEETQILDWVESSPENRALFEKERLFFDMTLFATPKAKRQTTPQTNLIRIMKWGARIAATIIIILGSHLLLKDYQYNKHAYCQTVTVPSGQRAQIILADGTKVWLNSKSTLTYSSTFGRDERNVNLDGEAYFEVTKNARIPFYVHTEKNQLKVVGTQFNVCAYAGSNEFEATLVEGIVDVYANKDLSAPITRLNKDEFFFLQKGKYIKKKLPSYDFLKWKEGLYCFDDAPFSCILNKLEKYYNMTIQVTDSVLLNYRCTGKFKEQDGIEHILKVIQKDHPFNYQIDSENNTITLSKL